MLFQDHFRCHGNKSLAQLILTNSVFVFHQNSNVENFTPRVANTLDANDIVRIIKGKAKESVKRNASDSGEVPTAEGASWLTKAKKYSLDDEILAVKMVMLLGTIHCPRVYSAATYETVPSIAGLEDVVTDTAADAIAAAATESASNCSECSNAAVAGSSRGSESPDHLADMGDMGDARRLDHCQELNSTGAVVEQPTSKITGQPINDNESALLGSAAPPEDGSSPVDAVVALDVPDDGTESSRLGQNFDDMLARRYETRVATIEAQLDIENAALDAALQAAHAQRITRGAPSPAPVQAAGNQHVPSGPLPRATVDPAGGEELEWFLDESPGNARPGSEQTQSPRQKSQPEHGKFGFDGRGKPID